MPVIDQSLYLRNKNCCKKIVEVCTPGPKGDTGSMINALLFYEDISLVPQNGTTPDISLCVYDAIDTSYNGVSRFIDNSGNISFSDLSNCNNCMVEIYCHCDAETVSDGQGNYVKFDLSGISIVSNTLNTIDIDTRSVEKGTLEHLSFGPCLYKLIHHSNPDTNFCKSIHTDNIYKLRVESGREYDLTEIKLIIKIINYET